MHIISKLNAKRFGFFFEILSVSAIRPNSSSHLLIQNKMAVAKGFTPQFLFQFYDK